MVVFKKIPILYQPSKRSIKQNIVTAFLSQWGKDKAICPCSELPTQLLELYCLAHEPKDSHEKLMQNSAAEFFMPLEKWFPEGDFSEGVNSSI